MGQGEDGGCVLGAGRNRQKLSVLRITRMIAPGWEREKESESWVGMGRGISKSGPGHFWQNRLVDYCFVEIKLPN